MKKISDQLQLTQNWLQFPDHVQARKNCEFPTSVFLREGYCGVLLAVGIYTIYLAKNSQIMAKFMSFIFCLLVIYFNLSIIIEYNKIRYFFSSNLKNIDQLYDYYMDLREANQMRILEGKVISSQRTIDRNGSLISDLRNYGLIIACFEPVITFANEQSQMAFQRIAGENPVQQIELTSTKNPFTWKKIQVYSNISDKNRKIIFWLYVVLSVLSMSWILQWYVNRSLCVNCKILIKKQLQNPRIKIEIDC